MIRHPSENFVKYLFSSGHSQASQDAWIEMTLVSLGYPRPDSDYLLWLRSDFNSKMPSDFQPTGRYHRPSIRFMRAEHIYGMHNPDKAAREAHLIVTNLRARPIIENLLLGRMDPKEIAKKVNARLGEFFTSDGIEAYSNYYWNVGKLSVQEWSQLLKDYDVQRANTLAILQVGPSMALHKMGFQQVIDSKSVLREMLNGAYFDFREWSVQPHSVNRTKAIVALAKSAALLDMQISQEDGALKNTLRKFEQFRMQHLKEGTASMRTLAPDGNFSGSGARLIEAKEAEETE